MQIFKNDFLKKIVLQNFEKVKDLFVVIFCNILLVDSRVKFKYIVKYFIGIGF